MQRGNASADVLRGAWVKEKEDSEGGKHFKVKKSKREG